ncbi:ferric-chelate reductase 1-like isoform X2 [Ptychodera flava]|uniref:ferric-chelate reductase 1-like isoform X2 n=1 Tax=Ptychodera flava TaxID=63121 RepID=UPI00396A9214
MWKSQIISDMVRGSVTISLLIAICLSVISGREAEQLVTTDGCGETKGCFQDPADCENSDCDVLVTWKANEGATDFGILGHVIDDEDYVGFGFSYDQRMGDDDVWACLRLADSSVVLDHSHNPGYSNRQLDTNGTRNFESSTDDDVIECIFTRLNNIEGREDDFFNLYTSVYYLLVARGPRRDINPPKLSKHTRSPIISDSPVNFTDVGTSGGGSGSRAAIKTHGSLMIFGWVGCASIAIILARYFKTVWPNSTLLGQKVWFTFHRGLMIVNLLCFCAAFVIIFVYVGGWVFYESTSDLPFVHATIGCIAVGLGITNPLIALCRPEPKSSKRPIFNWTHWAVGLSAHSLAVANVCLGIDIFKMPSYSLWIFIGWIGFHFLFQIFLEIVICVHREPGDEQSYGRSREMKDMPGSHGSGDLPNKSTEELDSGISNDSSVTKIKVYSLCIYLVVTIGILTYLIVEVCLQ